MNKLSINYKQKLIYLWLFSIPFSHAPSFYHPLITLHGTLSLFIIIITFTNISYLNKIIQNNDFFIIFIILLFIIISPFWSIPSYGVINSKFFNHYFAYVWFLLYLFSIYFLTKNVKLSVHTSLLSILLGMIISYLFGYVELFENFFSVNILSDYIPRYDMSEFISKSAYGFYRIRAFNYEPANYALLSNSVYPILFYLIRSYLFKLAILFMWVTTLFLTFSVSHLILGILIFSIIILLKLSIKNLIYTIFICILFLFFYNQNIINFFEVIYDRISLFISFDFSSSDPSGTSSQVRLSRLQLGLKLFALAPIFGHGFAGNLNFSDTGLNNFYLQTFVNNGILAILVLFIILYYAYFIIKNTNIYFSMSFVVCFIHLFFIGDFWLPQLFFSIAFTNIFLQNQNNCIVITKF